MLDYADSKAWACMVCILIGCLHFDSFLLLWLDLNDKVRPR